MRFSFDQAYQGPTHLVLIKLMGVVCPLCLQAAGVACSGMDAYPRHLGLIKLMGAICPLCLQAAVGLLVVA